MTNQKRKIAFIVEQCPFKGLYPFERAIVLSKLLNEDQIKSVLTTINNMREKYSKDELLVERCGTFGNIINSNNFECLAGKNMVVITPDRNVYPCVFDISEPIGILNNDNKIMINEDLVNKDSSYCKVLKKYNNI